MSIVISVYRSTTFCSQAAKRTTWGFIVPLVCGGLYGGGAALWASSNPIINPAVSTNNSPDDQIIGATMLAVGAIALGILHLLYSCRTEDTCCCIINCGCIGKCCTVLSCLWACNELCDTDLSCPCDEDNCCSADSLDSSRLGAYHRAVGWVKIVPIIHALVDATILSYGAYLAYQRPDNDIPGTNDLQALSGLTLGPAAFYLCLSFASCCQACHCLSSQTTESSSATYTPIPVPVPVPVPVPIPVPYGVKLTPLCC